MKTEPNPYREVIKSMQTWERRVIKKSGMESLPYSLIMELDEDPRFEQENILQHWGAGAIYTKALVPDPVHGLAYRYKLGTKPLQTKRAAKNVNSLIRKATEMMRARYPEFSKVQARKGVVGIVGDEIPKMLCEGTPVQSAADSFFEIQCRANN